MKTHLSFTARDIGRSVAFYRTLLDAEPVKRFDDYALFVTERPPLELALDACASPSAAGDGAHYGIAVEATAQVASAIERLRAAELPVDVRENETCCYAVQDKVWTRDPDGRPWEIYAVLAETPAESPLDSPSDSPACC